MKQKICLLMLIVMALLCVFSACDSEFVESNERSVQESQNIQPTNNSDGQLAFAKILSKAVYHVPSLRIFLKEEAEKQYDRDYDVFYPFVKDKVIENGKTFREILISYSSEKEISLIEKSVPLLTIMIPELSKFGAFSVSEWNVSDDQVAVTYVDGNEKSMFYADGDSLLSLPEGDLPCFPFMVVKSNERMKIVGKKEGTRTNVDSDLIYDFAYPEFDGSKELQTRSSYYDEVNTEAAPEKKPYLTKAELDEKCLAAYNLYKKNHYLIDREYIYYGLSPENSVDGKLDPTMREQLCKFRIDPRKFKGISDDEFKKDPTLKDYAFYKKGHPSVDQIAKELWTNGAFEIVFQAFMGNSSVAETKAISLDGSALFYINKLHVKYIHATGFRHSKWWYSATPDDLEGKWVDLVPEKIYLTGVWDLTNSPVSVYFKAFEKDDGATLTVTNSYMSNYTNKAELGMSGNIDKVGKLNLGFSSQITNQKTFTISYQCTDKDDELGSGYLNFSDPVIISDAEALTKGYEVYSVNTGSMDVVVVPHRLR